MAAATALPSHPAVARYYWNDQFFMCPLGEDLESDSTLEELQQFIRSQYGRKVGFNVVLREGAKPPTPARRARTRDQMRIVGPHIAHTATVILGAGLFASLFLGIAGTMMRLRPTETPRLLTQNLPDFSSFVAQHSRAGLSPFEVLSTTNWILRELHERMQPPSLRAAG